MSADEKPARATDSRASLASLEEGQAFLGSLYAYQEKLSRILRNDGQHRKAEGDRGGDMQNVAQIFIPEKSA